MKISPRPMLSHWVTAPARWECEESCVNGDSLTSGSGLRIGWRADSISWASVESARSTYSLATCAASVPKQPLSSWAAGAASTRGERMPAKCAHFAEDIYGWGPNDSVIPHVPPIVVGSTSTDADKRILTPVHEVRHVLRHDARRHLINGKLSDRND